MHQKAGAVKLSSAILRGRTAPRGVPRPRRKLDRRAGGANCPLDGGGLHAWSGLPGVTESREIGQPTLSPGKQWGGHSKRANTMAGLGTRFAQPIVTGSTDREALFTELLWFKRQHRHRPPSARAAPFRQCKIGPSRGQTPPPARTSRLPAWSGTLGRAAIRAGNVGGAFFEGSKRCRSRRASCFASQYCFKMPLPADPISTLDDDAM
jgi:hypothetical protein